VIALLASMLFLLPAASACCMTAEVTT
jgi:hypothetical protein